MKKLLFVLVVFLVSCAGELEDSVVSNPEKTTIEMQQSVIDSCAVLSYVDGKVYVLEEGVAVRQFVVVDTDEYTCVHDLYVLGTTVLSILFIVLGIAMMAE